MITFKYNHNNQTGKYRERINIQRTVLTKDSIGQNVRVKTDFGSYWAMVKTYTNQVEIRNHNERTADNIRFVVKYSKGLADLVESNGVEFDLTHNGRDYRVVEAINDNLQNKTITIRVELLK